MLAKTNMGEFAISPLESRVSFCMQPHHVRPQRASRRAAGHWCSSYAEATAKRLLAGFIVWRRQEPIQHKCVPLDFVASTFLPAVLACHMRSHRSLQPGLSGQTGQRLARAAAPLPLLQLPLASWVLGQTQVRAAMRRLARMHAQRRPGGSSESVPVSTGDSVRGPASDCACVGMRPTIGLASRAGIIPARLNRDEPGVLARTVEDLVCRGPAELTFTSPADDHVWQRSLQLPSVPLARAA